MVLDKTPKAQTEEKLDRLDFIKIKSFRASKDTLSKVKRQPTQWEKTFVNHVSDKELVSRRREELLPPQL